MVSIFDFLNDIRYGIRGAFSRPGFATVVILTLALGIGANVAILSLVQQILLRPLPVNAPDQLVNLVDPGPDPSVLTFGSMAGNDDALFSYPMFRDLEREQQGLAGIAAHRIFEVNISTGDEARQDTGIFVSGSYFPVLGLQPALGRLLGPQDDRIDGQADSVVLSHSYWENEFGADPAVLGRTLFVNGVPLTIIGVTPRTFYGTTVGARASVFVPITFRGVVTPFSIPNHNNRQFYWVHLFARLAPGVTAQRAAASMNPIYGALLAESEAPLLRDDGQATRVDREQFLAKALVLEPGARGQSSTFERVSGRLSILLVVSGAVLLLCAANVAGLMLIRGSARTGEIAVRFSMGATRRRLASLLVAESLVLALPAAIAAIPVALLTLRGIASGMPGIPTAAFDVELNTGAAGAAIGIALVSALVLGLFPLRGLMRIDAARTLQAYGARHSSGRTVTRFRTGLATTQIALSVALLAVTGVFAQSLANIARIDLGLDADSLVMFTISPEASGYTPPAAEVLLARMERELAAIPGVTSVASSEVPILTGGAMSMTTDLGRTHLNWISPQFFRTLGIGLVAGREFRDSDLTANSNVAIVNQRYAEVHNLGRDAIGQHIMIGDRDVEIVGLVANAKYDNVTSEILPQRFEPQIRESWATFYVRGTQQRSDLLKVVRDAAGSVDPLVPITDASTMQQQIRENLATERFVAAMSTAFAMLATMLAAFGVYGVLGYSVAQRSREIALRIALGAEPVRVRGVVLRQVATMALAGVALGVVAALLVGRAVHSLLFGIDAADPLAIVAAAVAVAAVTFTASYFPARRASRIDPVAALRSE